MKLNCLAPTVESGAVVTSRHTTTNRRSKRVTRPNIGHDGKVWEGLELDRKWASPERFLNSRIQKQR
ncbi:MAG: hypothetical protein EXS30_01625 [Pedosphaera sp.]|nr:hypothetical protein [Pedosphaera sp.]